MKKKYGFFGVLAGVAAVFVMAQFPSSAHNKVVVIPLDGGGSDDASSCTEPDEVLSEGQCWKDRNLGATQVATASDDSAAYGDLYQWGRLADGHQYRTSLNTGVNSVNDVPGHSNFITESSSPNDWRVPQNDNLWQGLGGINNPCPQGFRLPTHMELETERLSWSSNNAAGAFVSPLKLVVAGARSRSSGTLFDVGIYGSYWSSTVSGEHARVLLFESGSASGAGRSLRAYGRSVRCIKD